jgi:hypothetical protein
MDAFDLYWPPICGSWRAALISMFVERLTYRWPQSLSSSEIGFLSNCVRHRKEVP